MKRVILVNGVPASGKSTVARFLSNAHGWPLLGLDTIKEPFLVQLDPGDRAFNRKLGRASYHAIFDLVAAFPDGMTTVIDAWFGFQPLEVLTAHLERAGVGAVLEIWCHAAPDLVGERYAARIGERHPGHPGLDYVPELKVLAGRAMPLGGFPRFEIDTGLPLDEPALLNWINARISASG